MPALHAGWSERKERYDGFQECCQVGHKSVHPHTLLSITQIHCEIMMALPGYKAKKIGYHERDLSELVKHWLRQVLRAAVRPI